MSAVIVTGFEPFGNFRENPSAQIAEQLHGRTIADAAVSSLVLPVTFGQDTARLFPVIEKLQPQFVLSLGLAARATCLQVERIALNLQNSDDREMPIVEEGPAAYFATLDVDRVATAVRNRGIPAQPHVYAGTYLCNHVMYQTLHLAAAQQLPLRSGFIHLPLSQEQVVTEDLTQLPSLPLQTMADGVLAAIEAALTKRARKSI